MGTPEVSDLASLLLMERVAALVMWASVLIALHTACPHLQLALALQMSLAEAQQPPKEEEKKE